MTTGPAEVTRVGKVGRTEDGAVSVWNIANGSMAALFCLGEEDGDECGATTERTCGADRTLGGDHRRLPPSTARGVVALSMSSAV